MKWEFSKKLSKIHQVVLEVTSGRKIILNTVKLYESYGLHFSFLVIRAALLFLCGM